jgi:hypothetical protein
MKAQIVRRLVLLSALLVSCGDMGCTEIGGESGLLVHLNERLFVPFRVAVTLIDGREHPATMTVECPDPTRCSEYVRFPVFTPTSFSVRVTTAVGETSKEFHSVAYTKSQPNGPACPGTYYSATVEMDVPR